MRHRRIVIAATTVALLGLLGACADADEPGSPSPSTPSPPAELQTVSGELAEGVETGCVLLRTPTEEYLLITEEEVPTAGTLTVTGYPDPELATICQQGVPFVVEEFAP